MACFFAVPGGVPDPIFDDSGSIFVDFWLISGRFGLIFLLIFGDAPDSGPIPDGFSATFAGLRRVGAGMVPGYAVGLRYFFSGVPLGYGDLRAAI